MAMTRMTSPDAMSIFPEYGHNGYTYVAQIYEQTQRPGTTTGRRKDVMDRSGGISLCAHGRPEQYSPDVLGKAMAATIMVIAKANR